MAAWKRKGGLGPFHQRLVGRMVEKGYAPEYAESIFRQIQGFGEYGFPESHAASFALLVYVSAWIKHHHPDAFLAALLNSQPMGFYGPAQLVRDARAHGVEVRPVDALVSDWDCTLEAGAPFHGVRLGLSRVAGFGRDAGLRLVAARADAPFASVEDLARRAALDSVALQALAQSGALAGLAGDRHAAAWATAGIDTRPPALLEASRTDEGAPAVLQRPTAAEDMRADYAALGLSLTTHPLALLRATLAGFKVLPADVLKGFRPGQLARASGLVTHRQRPGTANGVVFVTLEDETGAVNVIVWPQVVEAQRKPLLAARLLTVYGVWQCQGEVRHLIAKRLIDHTALLQGVAVHSRDFR
jgi:error-prone DNA polymerase